MQFSDIYTVYSTKIDWLTWVKYKKWKLLKQKERERESSWHTRTLNTEQDQNLNKKQ